MERALLPVTLMGSVLNRAFFECDTHIYNNIHKQERQETDIDITY